jgi:hypothetical protein
VKITPTLEGGLRIDAEDAGDWLLLNGIANDALTCDEGLATRLGKLVTDEEVAGDWRDFVVPDLEDQFSSALLHVTTVIASARLEAGDGPGSLWITPEDGSQWFSALNQARLAIEEQSHFGPSEMIDPEDLPPQRRSVFLRSLLYCAIQSLLLEHVMR